MATPANLDCVADLDGDRNLAASIHVDSQAADSGAAHSYGEASAVAHSYSGSWRWYRRLV
jgi:hypothetical protein